MKIRKLVKIIAFTLTVTLLCASVTAVAPLCAEAAEVVAYTDVSEDDWFYEDVTALSARGVVSGYPDGSFQPDGNITCAEFTKLLTVALGLLGDAKVAPEEGIHWAQPYIDAAKTAGVIPLADIADGSYSPDKPITRGYMSMMMVVSLAIEPAKIDNPFSDASDAYAITAYNEYLLRGYPTENGREYRGQNNASRAEAAAIITRVTEYHTAPAEYKTLAILENALLYELDAEDELIDLFCELNRNFVAEFTFSSSLEIEKVNDIYKRAEAMHPELFVCDSYKYIYSPDDSYITFELIYDEGVDKARTLDEAARIKAAEIVAEIIRPEMTEAETVQALHDYLVLNVKYDHDGLVTGKIANEAYRAYGALLNKTAVCQGYSAAFNLLCGYAGLRSIAVAGTMGGSNVPHSWNLVLIDGVPRYFDVTSDDPVPDRAGSISYTFYSLSEAELSALGHIWDKTVANIKYFY